MDDLPLLLRCEFRLVVFVRGAVEILPVGHDVFLSVIVFIVIRGSRRGVRHLCDFQQVCRRGAKDKLGSRQSTMAQSHYMFSWPLCDPPLHSAKERVVLSRRKESGKIPRPRRSPPLQIGSFIPATASGLWRTPRI